MPPKLNQLCAPFETLPKTKRARSKKQEVRKINTKTFVRFKKSKSIKDIVKKLLKI